MATNINRPFVINTCLNKHTSLVNLLQNITPTIKSEIDIIEHYQYYSDTNFILMLKQVNYYIRIIIGFPCLAAKLYHLKLCIAMVHIHKQISCVALQETWYDQNVNLDFYSIIQIYNLISEHFQISSHGDVAIYLHSDFLIPKCFSDNPTVFENIDVEIWRITMHIQTLNLSKFIYLINALRDFFRDEIINIDTFDQNISSYPNENFTI